MKPTFVPDIVMIDLTTQESPMPARISPKVFPKLSLQEDKRVANVQPALQTRKVEVEISLPHPLPIKDRHNHRPSVSFTLPVESKRYPRTETSTPTHQRRYPKERRYEQPEEPVERIAAVYIPSIHFLFLLTASCYQANRRGELYLSLSPFFANYMVLEAIAYLISRRFDSVRDELHAGHLSILQGTLEHLERMHEERFVFTLNRILHNQSIFLAPVILLIWCRLRRNMP